MTLMTILREISRLTTKGKISEEDSRGASSALWGHQEGEEVGLLGRKGAQRWNGGPRRLVAEFTKGPPARLGHNLDHTRQA